jgi:hypothetical protein
MSRDEACGRNAITDRRSAHRCATVVLLGSLLAAADIVPARAQTPEVAAKIEKEFLDIAEKRKKLLTCTVTVGDLFVAALNHWKGAREHAKARMVKANFDEAFIEGLMQKTDPQKMVNFNLRLGELVQYCGGSLALYRDVIPGRQLIDVLDDLNLPR